MTIPTPDQIAHQIAGDWIMGPIDMGDLEQKIATAIRAERKVAEEALALAAAHRADFEGELAGGRELRKHLGALEHEPIWAAAERVKRENDVLKDALMRVLASTDAEAIQVIARRAQVTVWGEK